MKIFINEVIALSNGALWNNGDFGVRNMRNKESLSVHATGRAVDLSYRNVDGKGIKNGRREAVRISNILTENADLLGLEAILDYFPKPHGRGWLCSRDAWSAYKQHEISGAPGGDWLHLEISPGMADNPVKMKEAFAVLHQRLASQQQAAQ
jgi:hypothetical protein